MIREIVPWTDHWVYAADRLPTVKHRYVAGSHTPDADGICRDRFLDFDPDSEDDRNDWIANVEYWADVLVPELIYEENGVHLRWNQFDKRSQPHAG